MSVNIPFFDDLPSKAIKPTCRLWDAMMSADYNGVIAYNDFVNDLTRVGIAAPPRGVVRRWKAAVELGYVQRPAPASEIAPLPAHIPTAPPEPEADAEVPRPLSPSVKGKTERKQREKVQKSTVDVDAAHAETGEPVEPAVSTAMDDGEDEGTDMTGVLDDLGVRPADDAGEPISAHPLEAAFWGVQFAPVIDNAEALLDAMAAELNAMPIPPTDIKFIEPPAGASALVAVKTAAGRLLEEVTIQMTREIEQSARETAARMLREVAAELEGCGVQDTCPPKERLGEMVYVPMRRA